MEKEKLYKPKSKNPYFELNSVYMLLENNKVDDKDFIKIGKVFAILGNRIIFSNTYEFLTEDKNKIYNIFKEISFKEAKKFLNNSEALLDKNIFRR